MLVLITRNATQINENIHRGSKHPDTKELSTALRQGRVRSFQTLVGVNTASCNRKTLHFSTPDCCKTHLKIRHETGQGGRKRFPLKNQVYRRADNTFSAALWACHHRPPPMPVRGCICPFVGTQSHTTPVSRSLLMPLNAALADFA